MPWTLYQVRFRVLSHIHVGYQKLGNVQRTRPYVPARILWAALTAQLTRSTHHNGQIQTASLSFNDYEAMGRKVQQEVVFSYFYPANADGQPLYPHYRPKGLGFGAAGLTPETFAWRYLGSYASTALNYAQNVAEEGTLHEVEFIASRTRPDGLVPSYPVFLVGYVLVAPDCSLPWQPALSELQIGGERGYGWGRLRLELATSTVVDHESTTLFGWMVCSADDNSRPRVQVSPGQPLLAHTKVSNVQAVGDIEPLVGRIWDRQRGAGQAIDTVGVCYAPGACLEGDQPRWFEWTTAHVWEVDKLPV